MRSLQFLAGFLILAATGFAQIQPPSLQIADSIVQADPELIDLDNDGVLDIFLLMKSKSDKNYVGIIQGDTISPLTGMDKVFPIISAQAYLVVDYDRDNAMDILVSGERNNTQVTAIYLNKGGFQFEEKITTLPSFSKARLADLDNDAKPEMILSGENTVSPYWMILKQRAEFSWAVVHDSLKLKCSSIEVLDADGDGDADVFVSGKFRSDSLMSGFLINNGGLYFTPRKTIELAGNTSTGDINGDGFFDIVLMGEDLSGQWHTKKYQSATSDYTIQDVLPTLKNGKPFVADFNYDGIVDINYHGTTTSGDTVNVIQYSNGDTDLLPRHAIASHRFGDTEHDGNLDLLEVTAGKNLRVSFSGSMKKQRNEGPKTPTRAVALQVFNRVFMYWDKPIDDHTATNSLTFDLHLSGSDKYQTGEFDLLNEKRLTVTNGNNGTQNFKLLKKVSQNSLQFAIQAIDNSFHSGQPCVGGPGIGGNGEPCASVVTTEEISACSRERIVLESPPGALWFSFAKGYVGISDDFEFSSVVGDTLFYFHPQQEGCARLQAWAIKINDDTLKIEKGEKYACEGGSLKFEVEAGWKNISWTSQAKGALGNTESINYPVTQPDSVSVTISNAEGCKIIRKTAVKISKPDLSVTADNFKIMKGGEVPLQAEGAQNYSWSPSAGLNDANIPNPVATPSTSVQYTVTGYDSLGCTDQATVSITVEQTGFVPNLFSPNDDGQNDQLKIYGVVSAHRFTFSVYDREGALVFKTSDVSEAVQKGWDGTKNGTKQPPGVYFWKVKGEIATGPLLLNGKDSGSIVLIR